MPRHQCVIYSGQPSDLLTGLASVIQVRLRANYRCVYLNSPPMVAGMRASLSETVGTLLSFSGSILKLAEDSILAEYDSLSNTH